VIYVLHYYSPSTFTHQGADWTGQPEIAELRGVPWPPFLPELANLIERETSPGVLALLRKYQGENWDSGRIDWDMQLAAAWGRHWGVRVVVNEFGDFKPFSPPESRARWLHDVRTALERQKLGWAVWDYAAGFDLTVLKGGVRTIDPLVGAALGLASAPAWNIPDPMRPGPLPEFSEVRIVQLGSEPDTTGFAEGILAIDLNLDGSPDLVITPATYPILPALPVQFLLNDGSGILTPGQFDGPAPRQRFVPSIVAGHFLRSSKRPGFFLPDTGAADGSGAQSSLILPSASNRLRDATSGLPREIVRMTGAAAGDVDGDGIDDLAVFHAGVELLRNDGSGRFQSDPTAIADAGHFNCGAFVSRRDTQLPDLLVFGGNDAPARVLLNDGAGHFREGAMLPLPKTLGRPALGGCAAVADLDNDGNPDVVVAYTQPDTIQILMNNGDGTFRDETARRMTAPLGPAAVVRRVVVRRSGNDKRWVMLVTRVGEPPLIAIAGTDGKFVIDDSQPAGDPWVVGAADFNGDGLLDLVFGRGGGAPVEARFGQDTPSR
jgi:hypothetical protein